MMKLGVPIAGLRSVRKSEGVYVRIEAAVDCDGSDCGRHWYDDEGELEQLPPHFHMIVLGKIPDAGPRCYAVAGELPENVYESSHDD
jgi:hypothetical protein